MGLKEKRRRRRDSSSESDDVKSKKQRDEGECSDEDVEDKSDKESQSSDSDSESEHEDKSKKSRETAKEKDKSSKRGRSRDRGDRTRVTRDQRDKSKEKTKSSWDDREGSKEKTKSSWDDREGSKEKTKSSKDKNESSKERSKPSKDEAEKSKERTRSSRDEREGSKEKVKSNEEREKSAERTKSSREDRDKSKERAKSSKGDRDRSKERTKSSRDDSEKNKDKEKSRSERERNRGRSRDDSNDRGREKYRDSSRDRGRNRYRNSSRDKDHDRHRDSSRDRDRERYRDSSRDRNRDRYYEERDRYRSRRRDRSRSRGRDQERNWDRDDMDRHRYRDNDREESEERHGEIQSSYYGTELKKNNYQAEKRNLKREHEDDEERNGEKEKKETNPEIIPPKQKKTVDILTSKTGGAYIPPAKLRLMQAEINDKGGAAYQRIAWEALKKSIHGFINKVNTSNIGPITREILKENIVRGRGLLARSIIQAQAASLTFTSVYAALVAVINSKFPNIGELLLKRLAIQFKRGFRRNDKTLCISSSTFIAHLVNQGVAHEILILEILTLLVQTPTDDSIEVAIAVLKECGMKLTQVSRKGTEAIFEMLRNILHEGQLDKRVQYMIEVIFQIRKDGFKDYESVTKELDLVEEDDQLTHLVTLDEATDGQDILNVFKYDAEYTVNEDKYKELSKEILNTDDESDEEEGSDEEDDDENSDDEQEEEVKDGNVIVDNTETNLTALRRTIYLTIHSSLDFEECAHKLLKMQLKPGQEIELCHMFLDCCAEMRTYEKFFGLLAGRFCAINKMFVSPFEQIFKDSYDTIHRLDTNRLRNVAKFFAHLLMTDSISWAVLANIRLNEEDTTSSSRVFIKILFQELSEYMGLPKLNEKLKDAELQEAFGGLFPKDDTKNTRFAINFFTSIGLGGLTDDLREHLKSRPKPVQEAVITVKQEKPSSSSESSSSDSSSSSSDSSSSSSSESEDSSEDEKRKKKKKKEKLKKKKKVVKRQEGKENKNKKEKSKKDSSPDVKKQDKKQKKKKKK